MLFRSPHLHVHLYCRAVNAKIQKYGDPIIDGHKDEYMPLNDDDIKRIKEELDKIFKLKKFSDSTWGLS